MPLSISLPIPFYAQHSLLWGEELAKHREPHRLHSIFSEPQLLFKFCFKITQLTLQTFMVSHFLTVKSESYARFSCDKMRHMIVFEAVFKKNQRFLFYRCVVHSLKFGCEPHPKLKWAAGSSPMLYSQQPPLSCIPTLINVMQVHHRS